MNIVTVNLGYAFRMHFALRMTRSPSDQRQSVLHYVKELALDLHAQIRAPKRLSKKNLKLADSCRCSLQETESYLFICSQRKIIQLSEDQNRIPNFISGLNSFIHYNNLKQKTKVYGTHTFYEGGGGEGVEPTLPMISKTVDSTTAD